MLIQTKHRFVSVTSHNRGSIPARARASHPPPAEIARLAPRGAEFPSYADFSCTRATRRRGRFWPPQAEPGETKVEPNTGLSSRERSRAQGPPYQTRSTCPVAARAVRHDTTMVRHGAGCTLSSDRGVFSVTVKHTARRGNRDLMDGVDSRMVTWATSSSLEIGE